MTSFDDRKNALENKYAKDQEADFKTIARRNKMLGLWAAQKMGLKADEQEAYAKSVVAADFDAPGQEDVVQKLQHDFANANMEVSAQTIRDEMARLLSQVKLEQ